VSPRAFGVLSNLAGETSRSQQQLANAVGMHRNNMVGLIDEMEAAGRVRRNRSEQDRRAFDVRLTTSGSALVARVNDLMPALEAEMGQGLDPDERRELVAVLLRVARSLGLSSGVHPHLSVRPGHQRVPSSDHS
jgi:DNA-binding MarR family transcriptional regulator